MGRVWRDYSLSLVLAALFLVAWGLQTWMGWVEYVAEQQALGQAAAVFGPDGYVWGWGQATFENWQSEFLQLLTFVVLTTYLVHRGSHESKDTDEAMQAQLDRIERRLAALDRPGVARSEAAPGTNGVTAQPNGVTARPVNSGAAGGTR